MKIQTRFYFQEVDSTNTFARNWVERLSTESESESVAGLVTDSVSDLLAEQLPALVRAEVQTQGRGQGTHSWFSPSGCLMFSLVFRRETWGVPMEKTPLVGLTAALGLVDVLRPICSPEQNAKLDIHWPNDVRFRGRKLAGILSEGLANGVLIVGMGINLHNGTLDAPEALRDTMVSLREISPNVAKNWTADAFLETLLERLELRFRQCARQSTAMVAEVDALCAQKNHSVRLQTSHGMVEGFCEGLAPDGAIQIDGRAYYSGSVSISDSV